MSSRVRLGIIGAGAVTEFSYLPSLINVEGIKIVSIVDIDRERAQRLAQKYNIINSEVDYRKIADKVDAVIIALPNKLHYEVSLFFIKKKIHVLVEKPMATSTQECNEMIQEAEKSGVKLAVGYVRRLFYNSRMIKQIIDDQWIGNVKEFYIKEGGIYNWPTASGFYFNSVLSGGGALIDAGSHVLDLLFWWFRDYKVLNYQDDNFGGVEATCILKIKTVSGGEGVVKITRIVPIDPIIQIIGEKGWIKTLPFNFDNLQIFIEHLGKFEIRSSSRTNIFSYFKMQVNHFVNSILGNTKPPIDGYDGRKVVQLIEECYKKRQCFKAPWLVRT